MEARSHTTSMVVAAQAPRPGQRMTQAQPPLQPPQGQRRLQGQWEACVKTAERVPGGTPDRLLRP